MVVIECPYCEEDIEMDDDASGLFDCPYCDQEFEWGTDEEEVVSNKQMKLKRTPKSINIELQSDNPTLRLTAGIIFITVMAIYALSSISVIFTGMFVSAVEDGVSDVTDGAVDTSFGVIVILLGFVMLAISCTGIYFGVKLSKGKLIGLIASTVISVLSLILTIVQWAVDDSEECVKWETDPFMGIDTCAEYGTPSFPIFGTILWVGLVAMLATLLFTPKFNHQFD